MQMERLVNRLRGICAAEGLLVDRAVRPLLCVLIRRHASSSCVCIVRGNGKWVGAPTVAFDMCSPYVGRLRQRRQSERTLVEAPL
jgi:hypothetical protein